MNIPTNIKSIEQRDRLLHDLYLNRQFLQFVKDEEYFNGKVEQIFDVWINGDKKVKWGNNLAVERLCWEHEQGY